MTSPDSTQSRAELVRAEATGDLDAVRAGLGHPDPTLRCAALGALDRTGQLDRQQLQAALSDKEATVRCRAIELAIGDTNIDLEVLLDDPDDLVVESAAWALGERESDAVAAIGSLCRIAQTHEVSICREAAIAALGAIGSKDGLASILAGLDDRAEVRRRAVLALAPFDGPDVESALQRALTDRDRQVRQAAEDLLGSSLH